MIKNISTNFSKKRFLLFMLSILILFLVIYIFRASFADVEINTNSIDYSKYRLSDSFKVGDDGVACSVNNSGYACSKSISGSIECSEFTIDNTFNNNSADKQWVNVIVRLNNTVASGAGVYGVKHMSTGQESSYICTGSGANMSSTGAWFRHLDRDGYFSAEVIFTIPETKKVYRVPVYYYNLTRSVDSMIVNSSSNDSGNVYCYKYDDNSSVSTDSRCASWDFPTKYKFNDGGTDSASFTECLSSDDKKCSVHQLDLNLVPKFNVTYLDYDGRVLKDMTTYDYKTPLDNISKPNDPTRVSTVSHDYVFSGWSIDGDNGGVDYLVDDIVFVAKYKEKLRKYSITFKDYDGSILVDATSYDYGTTADKIKIPTPSHSGYKFIGWDSKVTTVGSDKVYTAVYKKTHMVSFSDGFGNHLGSVSVLDGDDATASISAPSRPGYKFSGWDKAITNIKADTTVTATWTLENYNITYDYKGGTASSNPLSYTVESNDIKLNNPTRDGYTFVGWTGTDLESATMDVMVLKGSTSNRSYIANWKINQHTVTLDKDSGISLVSGDGTYKRGDEVTITAKVKEGYDFDGWYNGDLLVSSDLKYTFKIEDDDINYKAVGSLKKFNVEIEKIKDDNSFFNDSSSFYYDQNYKVIFEEEAGYTIDTVIVDDDYIDFTSGNYDFENIKSDHKILINYAVDANKDNIPDKYQKTITYKVVNGVFTETLASDDIIINYNNHIYNNMTGKWENAKYKLNNIPEVTPNTGYLSGVWDVDINNNTIVKDDIIYTCTCTYDYKFTKQTAIKTQEAFGVFEIEWETNFTPVKIEKYNKIDNSLIGEVDDHSALTTTENLEEGEKIEYYLRVYYDDSHYIDSNSIVLKRDVLLPVKGDIGTIVYTVFGLLIVLVASIFLMAYRKKHNNM